MTYKYHSNIKRKKNMFLNSKKLFHGMIQNWQQQYPNKKTVFRKKMYSFNQNMPIPASKIIPQQFQQPKIVRLKNSIRQQRKDQLIELGLNEITFYPKIGRSSDFGIASQRKHHQVSKNQQQKSKALELTFMKPLPRYQQSQQNLQKMTKINSSYTQTQNNQRKRPRSVTGQRGQLKKGVDRIQKNLIDRVYRKRALSVFLKQQDSVPNKIDQKTASQQRKNPIQSQNQFLLSNCLDNNKAKKFIINRKLRYPKKYQFSCQAAQL